VRLDEQLVASHEGLLHAVVGTRYRTTQSVQYPHFRNVCEIAKSDYYLRHVTVLYPSGRMDNLAPHGWIFMKSLDISILLECLLRKRKFHYNLTRITRLSSG
jgi:hypothetical protein